MDNSDEWVQPILDPPYHEFPAIAYRESPYSPTATVDIMVTRKLTIVPPRCAVYVQLDPA